LGSITIPSGVTNIAGYAFFKCGLTNVLIPDTVSQIDAYAFASCVSLIGIAVDSNNAVYSSTNGVLFDKQQARLIQFPSGKAGHYVIPDSVTTIGASAFTGWSPLSAVTIPASVTNIENGAFAYCIYLTNATFLCKISSISDSTFFLCERLTTITIPDSVTAIGSWAFAESGLRNFTIPNAVTNIGAYAFYQCLDLAGLYFQGGAPGIDSATFSGDAKATVYYLPGTAGWGSIFGGLPTALWNPQIQTSDQTFGIHNNRFGFTVVGTTNIPVVIEASTDLVIRTWIPLQSSTLTNGSIYFADLDWTNYPYRFYRLRSP
jgi:hypothetical protein